MPHSSANPPKLSIIVVFFNMQREAKRTLYSMCSAYQTGVTQSDWEVIAIDNGSTSPLSEQEVSQFGENFRYYYHETSSVSPVEAVNLGVDMAKGDYISICIDGARILTPGVVKYTLDCFKIWPNPFSCTLAWHIGDELQNMSMLKGYNQTVEDKILRKADWQANGYKLFDISTLAGSSSKGFFSRINESNFFSLSKSTFKREGGFDRRFTAPGGGLVNLDFYKRISELSDVQLIHILGEGTFHQFHGGVATNVPQHQHPGYSFGAQYKSIRGRSFSTPAVDAFYLGHMPNSAKKFVARS